MLTVSGWECCEVQICIECMHPHRARRSASGAGETLLSETARALADAGLAGRLRVRPVACLGNCKNRCRAAIVGRGRWNWSFGRLTPERGAAFLVDAARRWLAAPAGLIPKSERPADLVRKTLARTPPPLDQRPAPSRQR